MNQFYWLLLMISMPAAYLANGIPRALTWIGMGIAGFALTVFHWHEGYPFPALFSAATDLFIAYIVYHYARELWEILFSACFQIMTLINMVYIPCEFGYFHGFEQIYRAGGLEFMNLAALSIIGITAFTDWARKDHGAHNFWRVHSHAFSFVALFGDWLHQKRPHSYL